MKLNGVELIPSSLVACFAGGEEVRITELAYEGFSFRTTKILGEQDTITLHYFQYQDSGYQTVTVSEYSIETKEAEFYIKYTVLTKQQDYKKYTSKIIKDYSKYISLKLSGDDAYLSEQMTGYPAQEDEQYYETFREQKREWFAPLQNISYEVELDYELAVSLDCPRRYQQYLSANGKKFWQEYLRQNLLDEHPLLKHPVNRLYLGNQFCHNLLPTLETCRKLLEKVYQEKLAVTLVFPYMRDEFVEKTKAEVDQLYWWCKGHQMPVEIVVNDWGMVKLLQKKADIFTLTLGTLLNKYRKDPRYNYKQGFQENVDQLSKNNLSSGNYRNFLKEKWNISRFEYEACGHLLEIPTSGNSLHFPYYQTNTSQYCTLFAKCASGNRGNQHLVTNCPRYCEEIAFLYPKHLKMVGMYNTLFGYDDKILKDPIQINEYLQHGIDRLVVNLL